MKRVFVALALCFLALQTSGRGDSAGDSLQMTAAERGFFQLGDELGQASFAYAGLAHQAGQVARTGGKEADVDRLAALAEVADSSRDAAREGFDQALVLMQTLHAPATALRPVRTADARLNKPLALSGDARAIALFSVKAARTLGALDEYNALSSVPEDPALQHWLTSPSSGSAAHVWFAEGLISALTQIAASQRMPELLPPVKEVATDLRGLRDWLTLRLPDAPSDAQTALETAIDDFLRGVSRTGLPQSARLSAVQLNALGDISQRLQAQVSGNAAPADPPPAVSATG